MPGSAPAPEGDYKFPCMGNSDEECGGDWRLNVYQFGDASPSASSTSSSTVPTSTPTAYTSEGCYTEATAGRALSSVLFYDDAMTVEKCAAVCGSYTWFGVE